MSDLVNEAASYTKVCLTSLQRAGQSEGRFVGQEALKRQ